MMDSHHFCHLTSNTANVQCRKGMHDHINSAGALFLYCRNLQLDYLTMSRSSVEKKLKA